MNLKKEDGTNRVVVTGGGIFSALGISWSEVFKSLKVGKNFIKKMPEWDIYSTMNTRLASPCSAEIPSYSRKKVRGMDRVARLALAATESALSLAGLKDNENNVLPELHNGRCGIAYGSSMGSVNPIMDYYTLLANNDASKINATTYIKAMPQTCAANLSVYYGLTGRLITTNTACTSGSQAIGFAYEAIKYGLQDVMLAGGAEELSVLHAACFDAMFSTSITNDTPELTPRPFDKNRDGLVVGEGAASLVLENYEHALKRGAKIYAELVGFGTTTDGTHITTPNFETMSIALSLAMKDANICPEQIGYVNAHGTATTAGDIAESKATEKALKFKVPISSIKSYIGHTLGACGAIEAFSTIGMMNNNWFCPTLNLTDIDPACAELDYLSGHGRNIETQYAMTNNFAFGGINTSLVLKKM